MTKVYDGSKTFVSYLQAIGRGQRSGRTLNQQEAFAAMSLLLENRITPEQRGAFLMLLRVREETAQEIAGFAQACRVTLPAQLVSLSNNIQVDLDIGAYAGKRRQLPWFVLAISCLVEKGLTVGLHGTQEPDSNRLYIQSVLSQLSARNGQKNTWQAYEISQIQSKLEQHGFVYADLALLHPQLNDLIQLRSLFGLRSCANTLARMLNPYNAAYSFQGVHHKHVDEKHIEVAQLLGDKNTLCIRGEGGEPELDPSKDTHLRLCRGSTVSGHNFVGKLSWEIKPKALEVNTMESVWKGASMHSYGENTVISTLAALLILLNEQPLPDAFIEAKKLWKSRDGSRFLGIDLDITASLDS